MSKKIIREYYILSCLFNAGGMSIISAVYVTFLLKNGLSLFEVNLVNAVFFIALFVCEIPTGAFADIFGRKRAFIAACGFTALGMFVYGSSHTFVGFISAEIIAAIGITFRSGAFQAWLVDSLRHNGYEGSLAKIFGRESLINQIFGSIGAVGGAYLAAKSPALPWFIGACVMTGVTIAASVIMKEEYFTRSEFSWRKGLASMQDIARSSIKYGTENKAVRFILIITFVQIYAVQAINMYWQPLFKSHGVNETHYGFLFTGMMIMLALGAFLASRSNSKNKERSIILRSQIYVGVMIIGAALAPRLPFALVFFFLHEAGRGFWQPMKDSYLHERIPSHERATITSFCSIAPHIGGAIGLLVSGAIAEFFGIHASWVVAGAVLVGGALLVRKNGYHPE